MADLNNTIVRGKLRVTEDINANGNITGNGVALSSVKNKKVLGTNANGLIEEHALTKNDVGLGNVDNTADSQKRVRYADEAGGLTDPDGNIGIAFSGI